MNLIDKLVTFVSPSAGMRRIQARIGIDAMNQVQHRYSAAAPNRSRDDWNPTNIGENAMLASRMVRLRAAATQEVRDNPLALRIIDLWTMHIIGDGMKVEFMPTDGVSKSVVKRQNKLFEEWAESTLCDAEGVSNLYGIQSNAAWIWHEKGEAFIRRMIVPADHPLRLSGKLKVPLQLKVLEPEFLDTTKNGTNTEQGPGFGNPIVMGIEFNKRFPDVRVAYWMYPEHPGESPKLTRYNMVSQRIPADQIAHIFTKTRNNIRGVTVLHAVLDYLRDLGDYLAALKMKAKIEACFTVMIHQAAGYQAPPGSTPGHVDDGLEEIEPGLIRRLKPGEDAKAFDPGSSTGHSALLQTFIRMISIGSGLTYHQVYSDLTGANYSSLRAGNLEFNRSKSKKQWTYEQMGQQPVCEWFVDAGHLADLWPTDKFLAVCTPAPSDFVDPKKDGDAEIQELGNGLTGWGELLNRRGKNPQRHAETLLAEFDLFENVLGIEHPFKKAMAQLGKPPSDTSEKPDETDDEDDKKEAA